MKLETDSVIHHFFYSTHPQHRNLPNGIEIAELPNGFLKVLVFVEAYDTHETMREKVTKAMEVREDLENYQGKTPVTFEDDLVTRIYIDTMYPFIHAKTFSKIIEKYENDPKLSPEKKARLIDSIKEDLKTESKSYYKRFTHQEVVETINLYLIKFMLEDIGEEFSDTPYFSMLENSPYDYLISDFMLPIEVRSISPKEKITTLLQILKLPKQKILSIYSESIESLRSGHHFEISDYPLSKEVIKNLVNNYEPEMPIKGA